jgi:hypothetical protein
MNGQLHYPGVLLPEITHWYSLNSILGGLQTRTGRFGEEGSILPVPGNEPRLLRRPGRGLHTAMTAISHLKTCRRNPISASVYPSWWQFAIQTCTWIFCELIVFWGTRWRSWLLHCATRRKVAVSIPHGVTASFHWLNPSYRTMALGTTRPLTEMCTRNISWG